MRASIEASITARVEEEIRKRAAAAGPRPAPASLAPAPGSAPGLSSLVAENARLKDTVKSQDASIIALRRQVAQLKAQLAEHAGPGVYTSSTAFTPAPVPAQAPAQASAQAQAPASVPTADPAADPAVAATVPSPCAELLASMSYGSHLSFRAMVLGGSYELPRAGWAALVGSTLTAFESQVLPDADTLPPTMFAVDVADGAASIKVIGESMGDIKFIFQATGLAHPQIVFADAVSTRDAWIDSLKRAGAVDFTPAASTTTTGVAQTPAPETPEPARAPSPAPAPTPEPASQVSAAPGGVAATLAHEGTEPSFAYSYSSSSCDNPPAPSTASAPPSTAPAPTAPAVPTDNGDSDDDVSLLAESELSGSNDTVQIAGSLSVASSLRPAGSDSEPPEPQSDDEPAPESEDESEDGYGYVVPPQARALAADATDEEVMADVLARGRTVFTNVLGAGRVGGDNGPARVLVTRSDTHAVLSVKPDPGSPAPEVQVLLSDAVLVKEIGALLREQHKLLIKAPSGSPFIILSENKASMAILEQILRSAVSAQ